MLGSDHHRLVGVGLGFDFDEAMANHGNFCMT
jgi:hypothetical protein